MLSLFIKPTLVDSTIANNLHECFAWALENFDSNFFYKSTELIHPVRGYFPDRADNEFDMAKSLCARIANYAGLSQWPFKVIPPQSAPQMPTHLNLPRQRSQTKESAPAPLTTTGSTITSTVTINGITQQAPTYESPAPQLELTYNSAMMKKPMDLAGSMSKNIAQHYLFQSQLVPPGGPENFDAAAEVVAIFMGFGIIIANSAYTFRGSCARCYDPRANRAAALSEDEAIYCLALFCHYKKIKNSSVTPSLKGYLRSSFKKARKQIERETSRKADRITSPNQ